MTCFGRKKKEKKIRNDEFRLKSNNCHDWKAPRTPSLSELKRNQLRVLEFVITMTCFGKKKIKKTRLHYVKFNIELPRTDLTHISIFNFKNSIINIKCKKNKT